MKEMAKHLSSIGVTSGTLLINGDALVNWVYSQQDIARLTMDDLELTEGIRNDFYRGKMEAYEEILKIISK